ncbi:hypothetical protein D3C72_1951930 [compost metagenome]
MMVSMIYRWWLLIRQILMRQKSIQLFSVSMEVLMQEQSRILGKELEVNIGLMKVLFKFQQITVHLDSLESRG